MDYDFGLTGILGNNYLSNLYQPYNVLGNNSGLSFQNILASIAGLNSTIGSSAVVVPTIASLDKDGTISYYLISGKKLVEATAADDRTGDTKTAKNTAASQRRYSGNTSTNKERAIAAYQRTLLANGFGFF